MLQEDISNNLFIFHIFSLGERNIAVYKLKNCTDFWIFRKKKEHWWTSHTGIFISVEPKGRAMGTEPPLKVLKFTTKKKKSENPLHFT